MTEDDMKKLICHRTIKYAQNGNGLIGNAVGATCIGCFCSAYRHKRVVINDGRGGLSTEVHSYCADLGEPYR